MILLQNQNFLEKSSIISKTLFYTKAIWLDEVYNTKTMNKNKTNTTELKLSVIGIDLGSHYTKLAAVEKGVVEIITNEANLRQTPTVVGYGNNERLIGEAGNAKIKSNLANTIIAPQRYLGFSDSDYTQAESKGTPCLPKNDNGQLFFDVNHQGKQERVLPEQATAALLTKMNDIVQLNKLSNKYTAIAVPSYFSYAQRKALLNAIQIAKQSSKSTYGVQLVNQSTAVGFDYGFYKKNQFPEKEEDAKVTLFVDFGHSKLSAYAMKFTNKYQKVIYEKHDRQLGCRNIDQAMLEFYSNIFEGQNTDLEIQVKESKRATLKLLQNIQRQRKVLSGNSQFDFSIECLLEEKDISYTMKRQQFENISSPVFQTISEFLKIVRDQLQQLGVNIGSIQLIGGGSRIPCFIKTLFEVFNMEPSRTLNSGECIARGAALVSAMNSGMFRIQPYYTFEVSPFELILSWKGLEESIQNQSNSVVVLRQSQVIMTEKQVEFTINPSSQKIVFEIRDSKATAGTQAKVCQFTLNFNDISNESAQKKIILTISFDENMLLKKIVTKQIKEKPEILQVTNLKFEEKLSSEIMKELIVIERQNMMKDAQILQGYEKKNSFESKIYSLKEQLQSFKNNKALGEFVNPALLNEYLSYFEQLENNLQEIANYGQQLKRAQLKIKEFQAGVQMTKNKYNKVEEALVKLRQYIDSMVAGRIKKIKFYPGEQVDKIKTWINQSLQSLKKQAKYEEPAFTVEEVKDMEKVLNEKIEQCHAEQMKKEKQAQKGHYIPQRQQDQRQFYGSPYEYNSPFGSRGYEPQRNRGRGRNNSYTGTNSGFFPGFSGFF